MMAYRSGSILILIMVAAFMLGPVNGDEGIYGDLERLPPMMESRYNHTYTAINGEIIVTGGTDDGYRSLSSCEKLNVDSGTWTEVFELDHERMRHTATLLRNGSLLVVGGFSGGGHPSLLEHFNGTGNRSLSSCELLGDSGWEPFPSLMTGRFWHASLLHPELGLIVLGGVNVSLGGLSSCEVLSGNGWGTFPSLPEPLVRFACCVLDDGDILVAGGHNGTIKKSSSRCYRFDIEAFRWVNASSMIHPRGYPGFLKLSDGGFIVSGGFSEPGSPDRSDSEIYDPGTDTWSDFGDLLFPRHGHGMVEVGDECIVIAGGSNCETGGCHSNLEVFDCEEGIWVDSGHLIMGRKWCGVNILEGGTVVVTGGRACNYPTADTDVLRFSLPVSGEDGDVDPVTVLFLVSMAVILMLMLFLLMRWMRR